jgi:hypothetical protein
MRLEQSFCLSSCSERFLLHDLLLEWQHVIRALFLTLFWTPTARLRDLI